MILILFLRCAAPSSHHKSLRCWDSDVLIKTHLVEHIKGVQQNEEKGRKRGNASLLWAVAQCNGRNWVVTMHLFFFNLYLNGFHCRPFSLWLHAHFADLYFLSVLDVTFFPFFWFNRGFDFYSSWSTRGKSKNREPEKVEVGRRERITYIERKRWDWNDPKCGSFWWFFYLNRVGAAVSKALTKEEIERLQPWVLPFLGPLIWLEVKESSTFVQKETKCVQSGQGINSR